MKFKDLKHKLIVLDSCVLAKPFLGESEYEKTEQLIMMHVEREATILITPLFFYEMGNIFLFKLGQEKAEQAMEKLRAYSFGKIDLDLKEQKKTIQLGKRHAKTSYYDCSYHTLAKEHDAIFITADEMYYKKAKKEGSIALLKSLN